MIRHYDFYGDLNARARGYVDIRGRDGWPVAMVYGAETSAGMLWGWDWCGPGYPDAEPFGEDRPVYGNISAAVDAAAAAK